MCYPIQCAAAVPYGGPPRYFSAPSGVETYLLLAYYAIKKRAIPTVWPASGSWQLDLTWLPAGPDDEQAVEEGVSKSGQRSVGPFGYLVIHMG